MMNALQLQFADALGSLAEKMRVRFREDLLNLDVERIRSVADRIADLEALGRALVEYLDGLAFTQLLQAIEALATRRASAARWATPATS